MRRSLKHSNRHHKKALKKLPLGVSSNFRYWGENKTIYIDHASGSRLWDIDGNEYVDYRMGYGPGILGYAEWEPGKGDPPIEAEGEGIPRLLKKLTHFTPLNDANYLEDLLKRHHQDIGAFLIEPIMGNCCSITANQDYIHAARELCEKYNVVMIVDEVKTGFRVAKGGVQELMGFKADLCTFAKALGNGYPISVVAGREDIMRRIGDGVMHGGTYTCHSVTLAAAAKTLEILDETDALETIAKYGTKLQTGISEILTARDIPHSFVGHP